MQSPSFPAWKRTPFLRILLPFALGICLEYYNPLTLLHCIFAGLSTIILLSFFFSPVYYLHRYRLFIGALIHVFLFSCGALCLFLHDERNNPLNLLNHTGDGRNTGDRGNTGDGGQATEGRNIQFYIASIMDEYSKRKTVFRTEATIHYAGNNNKVSVCEGKILLYFNSSDSSALPPMGSIIRVNKIPTRISSNANPGSFDFSIYSARNNIFYQDFIRSSNFSIVGKRDISFYSRFMHGLENHIMFILRKYIPKVHAGLAEALLIGYKEDLDPTLLNRYSRTGVIHVIAISGLHLALVYLLLEKITGRVLQLLQLSRNKKLNQQVLQALIVIFGLWIFTMLAGATPSVVRSAEMFTVIALGTALNKKPNIINSLAASAFLLLCFKPLWLWDIGFQLSYSAVLSLVIFAKPVYDITYIRNRLLDQLWKMSSVTLAAQLCTLPLILFHFHQFPVYFLPANLICVPLSSALLLAEIVLIAMGFLPAVANAIGWTIGQGINFMNASVEYFSSMPYGSITNIYFNTLQTLVLFISIGFLAAFVKNRKPLLFIWTLCMLHLILIIGLVNDYKTGRQNKLVIYHYNGSKAIQLINGRNGLLIADTTKMITPATLQAAALFFNLQKDKREPAMLYPRGNIMLKYKGLSILLLNKIGQLNKERADIIVLSSSVPVNIEAIKLKYQPSVIVMDGSNRRKNLERWKAECERLSMPFHVTAESGAFVMNLNSSNFAASHKDVDQ